MLQISKELYSALEYFSSDTTFQKYANMAVTDESYVISAIPNEATGHVGPVELSSTNKTLEFIEEIKSALPRRIIKL